MSQFSFADYANAVNAAQNKSATNSVKIGWFKLAEDQDEALVRINISKIEDMQFATIHQLGANTNWMKVSCLDTFGSYEHNCPLCAASAAGNASISKATKKVYIPMLVSYKDRLTGQWSVAIPVIWERPALASRELATKLNNYGDLRQLMFKVVRNGAKGDMKTSYAMDPVLPNNPILTPDLVPQDFSAFDNFRLDKHSFWVKSADEIAEFLQTGHFAEIKKDTMPTATAPAAAPAQPVYQQPVYQPAPAPQPAYQAAPVYTPPTMLQPQFQPESTVTPMVPPTPVQTMSQPVQPQVTYMAPTVMQSPDNKFTF